MTRLHNTPTELHKFTLKGLHIIARGNHPGVKRNIHYHNTLKGLHKTMLSNTIQNMITAIKRLLCIPFREWFGRVYFNSRGDYPGLEYLSPSGNLGWGAVTYSRGDYPGLEYPSPSGNLGQGAITRSLIYAAPSGQEPITPTGLHNLAWGNHPRIGQNKGVHTLKGLHKLAWGNHPRFTDHTHNFYTLKGLHKKPEPSPCHNH